MRWRCAVGEAGEWQVRRVKSGRWVGSNRATAGARGDLNRNERRERRADSWGWRVCSSAHLSLGGLSMLGT